MKNMLLVDDNELLLEALVAWFNYQLPDFRIFTGSNGKDGINILKQTSVDLIMTDLRMPVMDGFKLIEERNSLCPNTPLVAMTSDYCEEVIDRLKALGVTHCIEKPFEFN